MEVLYNETIDSLFADLGIETPIQSKVLKTFSDTDSRFARDLKLNIATVLKSNNLSLKEAYLLALSTAVNEKCEVLMTAFEAKAKKEGADEIAIAETYACTALMNTNNVFYRFRHYMDGVDFYNNHPAGLRMNIMLNPALGKEFFELMSLAVSALNGCERCVRSHEHSVKEQGASEQRIYDAIRLVSVIKSLCIVI